VKLSLWTYEGPTHVGAMRVVNSMKNAHFVLHAPQGDTYADLLFTMIERQPHRPPVTYTTFQARDLGADTANLFVDAVRETAERYSPDVMFVGESCTAELIQDQPGALARGMKLDVPIVPLELPAYSRKENYGASETLYALVRAVLGEHAKARRHSRNDSLNNSGESAASVNNGDLSAAQPQVMSGAPSVNLIGPSSLGFRCRDDVTEITRLLAELGVNVNAVVPLAATLADVARLPDADANICLYPETGETTCQWLQREFGQPCIDVVPIGVGATRDFIKAVADCFSLDASALLAADASRLPWYSRSIDSNYLTGKRVFIFGDATHALTAARIATEELGFEVAGLGTYSREYARPVREAARYYGVEPLITDDYLDVEAAVKACEPELVLGTQMERHIAKRLGIACCVISAPFHVEDVPARYAPQMGYEGANVIFDNWVHPLMMGLEEHLLGMFTDDFEFNDESAPSHLGGIAAQSEPVPADVSRSGDSAGAVAGSGLAGANDATIEADATLQADAAGTADKVHTEPLWADDAQRELKKIPFFVRGKAKRNTERYAVDHGLLHISIETLYDAKAHYSS
jgi:light-independent protochlorophyllide reductase subunit B